MLIGLGSNTFGGDLVDIFWVGSFMLFPLFSASLYIMAYWFTKSHIHAVLATVIGLSVTEFGQVPNLQVLFPSSFVMSIFPITFFVIDYIWNKSFSKKKLSLLLTLIIFSGFILLHFELGIVLTLTMSAYLIISHYVIKHNFFNLVIRITIIILTVFLFFYYFQYFTHQILIPNIFNDNNYNYNLAEKIKHLQWWYTNEIIIISLAGIIALSFYKDRKVLILGLLASLFLIFYFQDIGIIHRVMTLERPLLSFAAAALLVLPITIMESHFLKNLKTKLKKEKPILNNSTNTQQINIQQNETNFASVINNDEISQKGI